MYILENEMVIQALCYMQTKKKNKNYKKDLKPKKKKMILTRGVQGKNMHAIQKSFIKSTM